MLEQEFKDLIVNVKKDVLSTRYKIMENANFELIHLYYRLGKLISENSKYGNKLIDQISIALKLEFPNMNGFSSRNLSRMKKFYEEYHDLSILPTALAKLPWSHNYLLIEKIKDRNIRLWYANKSIENGWSHTMLNHQIDLQLYERQVLSNKLTNFKEKLESSQSELAREMIKDPYIFELEGIEEKRIETTLENKMLEKIKNVLLELGKEFSFVGNQYKVSTNDNDYYIDLLFYHLNLRCYVVVELKTKGFKPEYIGQLGFYVTAIDKILKKDVDNPTIGLLLCKEKDKLSVEWSLESTNTPIGVSSYKIQSQLPKNILEKLPTEQDINRFMDYNN